MEYFLFHSLFQNIRGDRSFITYVQENTAIFIPEPMWASKISHVILKTFYFLPGKLYHDLWNAAVVLCREMPEHSLPYWEYW